MASIEVLTVLGFDACNSVCILSGDAHFTLESEDSIFAIGFDKAGAQTLYSIVYMSHLNGKASFHVYEDDELLDNAIVGIGQPLMLEWDVLDDA